VTLAYEAMMFAREAHKAQRRKYTNNPYADHLAEVAGIVSTVMTDLTGITAHHEVIISVAWLHDYIEDCRAADDPRGSWAWHEIQTRFGDTVADGVAHLSDGIRLNERTGNRAERKAASRRRLAEVPGWVQSIKCADLISNTSSIVQHDPKFAVTYLEEKRLLLDVLTKADPRLLALAREQVS